MKFTVQKSVLMSRLTPAMGTVSNKNTITSIEGVLIETIDGGKVRISTYDMNKGVRSTFDAISIEREGKFIVNAQRLYQTVRVLPEDEVTIDVNDKLNCTISSGKASFSMFAMKGEDFPNLPDLVTDRGFTVSSENVRKMIGKVAHSVADQDNRPMLCGAFFKISDGKLEVVSCDSYTLSICTLNCDIEAIGNEGLNYSFIIPGHALGELSKNLADGDDEMVKFYLVAEAYEVVITKSEYNEYKDELEDYYYYYVLYYKNFDLEEMVGKTNIEAACQFEKLMNHFLKFEEVKGTTDENGYTEITYKYTSTLVPETVVIKK